jgi:hypothetical protein
LRLANNGGVYQINLYQGADLWVGGNSSGGLGTGVVSGNVVSMVPGLAPVIDYNSVNNNTHLYLARPYKATTPSPLNGSTIQSMSTPSQTVSLSWTKPLPEDVAKPVTSSVYISTDPNMVIGVTTLATGIAGNSVDYTVDKLNTYYWRVDSTDPNKAVPLTTGDVWSFNTNNTAPTVGISAPQQTTAGDVAFWLPGNTTATVTSVVTDDGYPIGGPVTYQWMDDPNNNGTGTVVSTDPTMSVTYTTVAEGATVSTDHRYRLTVNDGSVATVRTFLVRVFVNTCVASGRLAGYDGLTGDFSGDCKVSFTDFATFANNWAMCNATGGVCN